MISARKLTRIIVRRFWGACAFILISLAVFVVIGRELSPKLDRYKDEFANYLSEQLAVDVRIQTMQVDWSGLSPQLSLNGVALLNSEQQVALSMGEARLQLNLVRTILNRNLALDKLEASNVDMDMVQNNKGIWGFRGLPWQTTANDNINIDDPLDVFLLISEVELTEVQMRLSYRDGDQNQLNFPRLSFANNGDFHRLNSSIVIDNSREAASMILEFRGDPRALDKFSAKGYTSFQAVDIEKVTSALPGDWQSDEPLWRDILSQGSVVTAESWFDIFSGGEVLFRGHFDVEDHRGNNFIKNKTGESAGEGEPAFKMPQSLGGNFTGRLTARGYWSVSVRDAMIKWSDFQAPDVNFEVSSDINSTRGKNSPVQLRIAKMNVADWLPTLKNIGIVHPRALEALEELQPQGQLTNVKLSVNTTEGVPDLALAANFNSFNVSSWRGTPIASNLQGFANLSGRLNESLKGEVLIDTRENISIQFPSLYDQPMLLDSLVGQVDWEVNIQDAVVRVYSGLISAGSTTGNAKGYFDLTIPLHVEPGHEELILQLGMKDIPVKSYDKYVPHRLPQTLLDWLESSLGTSGQVKAGGFLYRGGVTSEGRHNAEYQLYADIENADIRYHSDWPVLTQASGELWLDKFTVHADVYQGRVMNSAVKKLTVDVQGDADLGEQTLRIDGSISGNATDGLDLLRGEGLRSVIGDKLDDWSSAGPVAARVNLTLPLQPDAVASHQEISIDLLGVNLTIPQLKTDIEKIKGNIRFSDKDLLQAGNLTGRFLDKELSVAIKSNGQEDIVQISASGSNDVETIKQWAGLDMLSFIEGEARFNVEVTVPGNDSNRVGEFVVQSDLLGTAIDLPSPLGKVAEDGKYFQLKAPFGQRDTYFYLQYGDELQGIFHNRDSDLRRGVLSFQQKSLLLRENLPQDRQILLQGQLTSLDFDHWRKVYDKYFSGLKNSNRSTLDGMPVQVNLQVGQFNLSEFSVDELALTADIRNNTAAVNLASETIAGDITIYDQASSPIKMRLQRLRLPKTERTPPTWSNIFFPPSRPGDVLNSLNPKEIPALDFEAEQVFWGEESLGAWSFNSRPVATGLAVTNLRATFAAGRVEGLQAEEGARLTWLNTGAGTETRIEGRLQSTDLAAVLKKWNQPQMMQSEDAEFDFSLRWVGAPTNISTTAVQGEVALRMEQGSFYREGEQSAGGALLQLVSIFNFDTWVRRLRLDFSDLGRRGLSFDQVEGLLRFESGQVYLDKPIEVQTQSGEFQLTGVVDLEKSQLDTKLTATLPMGGNLTFLTALAAGLPAAAGVWVVSKVFEEQIDKVSTLSYSIDGSLQNPNIEFERLFDNKP